MNEVSLVLMSLGEAIPGVVDIEVYPPELAGMAVRFTNGLAVSIRWGLRSYASQPTPDSVRLFGVGYPAIPDECEVAVKRGDQFVKGWPGWREGDMVAGWLDHSAITTVLRWAADQP